VDEQVSSNPYQIKEVLRTHLLADPTSRLSMALMSEVGFEEHSSLIAYESYYAHKAESVSFHIFISSLSKNIKLVNGNIEACPVSQIT
jgi:hypothetical protein